MEAIMQNRVVKTIPAKSRAQILGRTDSRKIRTAAYARVSTDRPEQEDSYERQVESFTRYINGNPDWELAGIFADPAITGTRADKRPEFNRMIQACRDKKLDRIIVKSISRFARNTVDALTYIRELKELGIAIFFDEEKVDTMTPGGEILITILAGMAEQESRNIAKNVTWAFEKKMLRGDIILNTTRFLGYKKNEDGSLSIVPEEAEIVSRIYSEYLQGYSTAQIAHHLMDDGVPAPSGNKITWYPSTILSMLKNEKYMGTVIQGKTFKPDVLSKTRHKNIGQRELHTMEDCMPAIISRKKFELVQTMLGARKNLRSSTQTGEGKFSSKYAFSGMLYCGTCGGKLRRHAEYRQGVINRTWACATHIIHGDEECTARSVREDDIKDAFVRALKRAMEGDYARMLVQLKKNIKEEVIDGEREQIARLSEQIDVLREQILTRNRSKRTGALNDTAYGQEVAELELRIDAIEREKQSLIDKVGCLDTAKNRIETMFNAIERIKVNTEFDDGVFKELVKSVTITEDRQAEIHFNCGITISEPLE